MFLFCSQLFCDEAMSFIGGLIQRGALSPGRRRRTMLAFVAERR
jgi:hypothetical protein